MPSRPRAATTPNGSSGAPRRDRAAGAKAELDTCHHAVTARGRALRLATIALVRWEEHVHHMDMLRAGEMTPEQATELWLQNWQAGDREIRRLPGRGAYGEGAELLTEVPATRDGSTMRNRGHSDG